MKVKVVAPNWCPYCTYIWSKQEIEAWIDANRPPAFYDGRVWKLSAKRIFGNRYDVKFQESR